MQLASAVVAVLILASAALGARGAWRYRDAGLAMLVALHAPFALVFGGVALFGG